MPRRTLDDLMNGPSDDERDGDDDDTAVMNPVENRTDDLLDEEDYLPQPVRRTSKLTVALVAALVCGVGLVGGIWIQKQVSAQATAGFAGTGGQGAPGGGFPGGAPGGGFPGGAPGGAPTGAGDRPGGANGGGAATAAPGSEATTSPLAVVGTVTAIKGNRLTVTDLGDRERIVTLADTTPITTPFSSGGLAAGNTVSVYGNTGSDGTVQATAVTVR